MCFKIVGWKNSAHVQAYATMIENQMIIFHHCPIKVRIRMTTHSYILFSILYQEEISRLWREDMFIMQKYYHKTLGGADEKILTNYSYIQIEGYCI